MTHVDRVRALLAELDQACVLHEGDPVGLPKVYFIQAGDDGPIKIGHAMSPHARIWDLQAGNHVRLRLLAEIPGTEAAERAAHEAFSGQRIRGEWFRNEPPLSTFVALLTDPQPGGVARWVRETFAQ